MNSLRRLKTKVSRQSKSIGTLKKQLVSCKKKLINTTRRWD